MRLPFHFIELSRTSRSFSMFTIKTLRLSQYYSHICLKPPINPYGIFKNPDHAHSTEILKSLLISLATQRPISISSRLETPPSSKSPKTSQKGKLNSKNKRPLDVLFKEALGLCPKSEIMGSEIEENGDEDSELKNKLWVLELELRQLKAESEERGREMGSKLEEKVEFGCNSKPKSLVALFSDLGGEKEILGRKFEEKVEVGGKSKPKRSLIALGGEKENLPRKREEVVLKEISGDMQLLLRHLYDMGYFKDVNFLPGNTFDVSCFDSVYARDFLKSAVERFGEDHQEISKWLSGSDLKTLALFGCPSLKKREVFAAKRLRFLFEISEESVCSKCCLKESCKFVNQSVWSGDNKNLRLDLLMRLLRTYSLEDIPPQLKLTQDLKACVSQLMHEIINLSKSA